MHLINELESVHENLQITHLVWKADGALKLTLDSFPGSC